MDNLIMFMPLLPLLAALIIGGGQLSGLLAGERYERLTAGIASLAVFGSLSLGLSLCLVHAPDAAVVYSYGNWLNSEVLEIGMSFYLAGINIGLALLAAGLTLLLMRFAVNYLHREQGFHRFFFVLCLFAAAMQLLLLSATTVGTFMGWELAGVSSYLLVAYAYSNAVPAFNATRILVTNRIGDAAFLLGIGLSFSWLGDMSWDMLKTSAVDLQLSETTILAICFALAAFAKSAQIPFTPWLGRAMEGPTVSSALFYGSVMVHSGVFLVIFLQPLFEQSVIAMWLLVTVGVLTAVYSYFVGLTQTDVKSSYSFAISAQLGLMFAECGLGFWQLALWHLVIHAIVRAYQLLNAPGFMHLTQDVPPKPFFPVLAQVRWAYVASLQRVWLDPIADWTIVHPALRLAKDMSYFDDHVIDTLMGIPAPAINALSSLAQLEEQKIGANLDNDADNFARGSGLAGKLAEMIALILHWVEDRLVLRGVTEDALSYGRHLGHIANRIEQLLLRPRYLSLFVFITLLAAF